MEEWQRDMDKMAELGFTCLHGFAEWHDIEYKKGVFDFSDKLNIGDDILITDVTGNRYTYLISDIKSSKSISKDHLSKLNFDFLILSHPSALTSWSGRLKLRFRPRPSGGPLFSSGAG